MATSVECLECGHSHDVVIVRGETEWQDYAEAPAECDACGAEIGGGPNDGGGREERRQMGICF